MKEKLKNIISKKWVKITAMVMIAVTTIVLVPIFTGDTETALAATCPGKKGNEYDNYTDYKCGCSACGGSFWAFGEVTGYDKGSEQSDKGDGYQVREETETMGPYKTVWKVYYRCYNCGDSSTWDCPKYGAEMYRVFVSTTNPSLEGTLSKFTESNPNREHGSYEAAKGFVPWHECLFCGYTQVSGLDSHNTCYRVKIEAKTGGTVSFGSGSGNVYYEDTEGTLQSVIIPRGESITINASADTGYEFDYWAPGSTTDSSTTVKPSTDTTYSAVFKKEANVTPGPTPTPTNTPTPTPSPSPVPTSPPGGPYRITERREYYKNGNLYHTSSSSVSRVAGFDFSESYSSYSTCEVDALTYNGTGITLEGSGHGLTTDGSSSVSGILSGDVTIVRKFSITVSVPKPTSRPTPVPTVHVHNWSGWQRNSGNHWKKDVIFLRM